MERLLRNYLNRALDEPNWKLEKRTGEGMSIFLEDNKRIVSLVRSKKSDILGFTTPSNMFYSLTIKFRRENGKWIITR